MVGRSRRPSSSTSRKPRVVTRAQRAPRRSMTALVAIVVPCTMRSRPAGSDPGRPDKGVDAFGEDRIRAADHRAFDDAGMMAEDVLDLDAIDLVAGAIDHVLLAVEDAEISVRVDGADVAGAPIATGEARARRLGVVPVAGDHHGPRDPELARSARGNLAPRLVADQDID